MSYHRQSLKRCVPSDGHIRTIAMAGGSSKPSAARNIFGSRARCDVDRFNMMLLFNVGTLREFARRETSHASSSSSRSLSLRGSLTIPRNVPHPHLRHSYDIVVATETDTLHLHRHHDLHSHQWTQVSHTSSAFIEIRVDTSRWFVSMMGLIG